MVPCGTFGNGQQAQLCIRFQWKDDGFCADQSECIVGDTRTVKCGLNDRGASQQTCVAGWWADNTTCTDPDVCLDGTSDAIACGIEDLGTQARTCVGGTFQNDGDCEQVLECDEGETENQACGFNSNGTQSRGCTDQNLWEDDFGPCMQTDTCENGDVIRSVCAEQGVFGPKIRERVCENGQWEEFGECFEEAECAPGATDRVACGEDNAGIRERSCTGGAWRTASPCYQTGRHILAAPAGMMVLVAQLGESAQPRMFGDNELGRLAMSNRPAPTILYPRRSLAPSPRQNSMVAAGRFAASATHACAINESNQLYCWGSNADGQLGVAPGTAAQSAEPLLVRLAAAAPAVVEVAVGEGFTCARTSGNLLYCFGRNTESQLGVTGPSTHTPVRPSTATTIVGLAAGAGHACFRDTANDVYCWGRNASGQASPDAAPVIATPKKNASLSRYPGGANALGSSGIRALVAGDNHTLVVWEKSGTLLAASGRALIGVGANDVGQLGRAASAAVRNAVVLENPSTLSGYAVLAKGDVTCITQTSGTRLRCTGRNAAGAIAAATTPALFKLTSVSLDFDTATPKEGIGDVAVGANHLCVLLQTTGRIRCRGANNVGQLGDGTVVPRAASGYVLHESEAP